jgi:hypothetical protein
MRDKRRIVKATLGMKRLLLLILLALSMPSFANWGDTYYCQMTTIYNVDPQGEKGNYELGKFKFNLSKSENAVIFGAGGYFDNQKMDLQPIAENLSSWSASQKGLSDKMFFADGRIIYSFVSRYFTSVLTADCEKF